MKSSYYLKTMGMHAKNFLGGIYLYYIILINLIEWMWNRDEF